MGYYIECEHPVGKAMQICRDHGAERSTWAECREVVQNATSDKAVIVVVNNGMFEAAGFAFDVDEFKAFTLPDDERPRSFLIMDRKKAEELSGYSKRRQQT